MNATPQDFVQLQLSLVTPMQILLLKYIRCSFLIKILDSRMNFYLNCSRTLLKSEKSAGGEKEERGAGRRRRPAASRAAPNLSPTAAPPSGAPA